ncbi:MAG: hypothetical protein ACXU8N_01860 [Telluria sp.]
MIREAEIRILAKVEAKLRPLYLMAGASLVMHAITLAKLFL